MLMRYLALGWLWLAVGLLPGFGQGTSFRGRYQALMQQHKTKEATAVVAQWAKAQPRDPDLYVARFNLLLNDADVLALSSRPAQAGEFSIQDPKTAAEVGSIGPGYNPLKVNQANEELRKGLQFAPDRLDMRFGIAYAANLIGDAEQQYQTVQQALAWRASTQGTAWRWRDGGALPNPEAEFVPATVEGYMVPYWQGDTEQGYRHALALAELLLTYYPSSALGYFNKGLYYSFTKRETEAYKWFEQADQRNPDDPQNLNNLLRLSLNRHDKAAAQRYLDRLGKYPDFKQECQQYTDEISKL